MKKLIRLTPILILFFIYLSCGSNTEKVESSKKIAVRTALVQEKEISIPVMTSGKVAAQKEIKLSFKIGGIINSILADEGQTVQKGDILASLDLAEIKAQVTQARSGYDKAVRDHERVQRLFADSVATLEQMQDVTTALDIAQSGLNIAEFNLKHAVIYAPHKGRIMKRFVEKNELVGAGMPAFLFASIGDDWIVRVGVSDKDVVRLQISDSATVNFDVYPDVDFPATVTEIGEAADPMSGTYEVELRLNPGAYKMISGFVGKVKIMPQRTERLAIIPIDALIEGDKNQAYVFRFDPESESVRKVPVEIARIFENEAGIRKGLEQTREIVTDGAPYLTDGIVVQVY